MVLFHPTIGVRRRRQRDRIRLFFSNFLSLPPLRRTLDIENKVENASAYRAGISGDDDLALLRGFVERGDRAALGALFSRHADTAYRFALRLCRYPADAEDVLQGAFLEVFRRASAFRGESSVRSWILGFVLNLSRNKAREEARRKARQERTAAETPSASPEAAVDPEVAARVRRAVDELPEHYRAPVWLHYGEGLSPAEVAVVLDLPKDTVRKQLSRGIEQLRAEILPLGAGLSVVAILPALAVETAPPAVAAALATMGPATLPAASSAAGVASKLAATVTAVIALTTSATFLWWGGGDDDRPRDFVEIERRVREWQPTPDERRFDEIGWVRTIAGSFQLARESGRAVVLLTQSGRINLGRSDGGSQFLRARALSDPRVIELLNSCFVPAYISNADYDDLGGASPEEKKLRTRIWVEAEQAKLPWGMDFIYLLEPADGRVKGTLQLSKATPDATRQWLEANRRTPPGATLVRPSRQSVPPPASSGALVLHLTARYLDAEGRVETHRPDFHEVPGEDWIVLSPDEGRQLAPPPGESRLLGIDLARRILTCAHPSDISVDIDPDGRNRIEVAELKATRASRSYVRLEGRLEMRRTFTQLTPSSERTLTAILKGFVELEAGGSGIRSLRMATLSASSGGQNFGVAIRSLGSEERVSR
jgi:RNA polymerase sigma factor (sigma-70 family)